MQGGRGKRQHSRRYYDVLWSDGNDSSIIGVVDVRNRSSVEHDAWYALDKALQEYAKPETLQDWERPYGDAAATIYEHNDDCDCPCHERHYTGCSKRQHNEDCPAYGKERDGVRVPSPLCECDAEGADCDCDGGDCGECGSHATVSIEPCPDNGYHHFAYHSSVRGWNN